MRINKSDYQRESFDLLTNFANNYYRKMYRSVRGIFNWILGLKGLLLSKWGHTSGASYQLNWKYK